MLATASETGQDLEVGTIAGSLDRILARARLPSRERREPDEARADALGEQLIEIVRNGSHASVVVTPHGLEALRDA